MLHGVGKQSLFAGDLTVVVDGERAKEQHAARHILPVLRNADHVKPRVERLHQKHAQHDAWDRAHATDHRNAAEVCCGDGVKVDVGVGRGVTGTHTTGKDDACHCREDGGHDVAEDLDLRGVDTGKTRRFRVAADGEDAAAELGFRQNVAEDDEQDEHQIDRVRNAEQTVLAERGKTLVAQDQRLAVADQEANTLPQRLADQRCNEGNEL